MAQLNEVQRNIAEQSDVGLLHKRGFRFITLDKNSIRLNKGKKNFDIHYDEGSDTYKVEKHSMNRKFDIKTEKESNVYAEDLRDDIDRFFHLKGFVRDVRSIIPRKTKQIKEIS